MQSVFFVNYINGKIKKFHKWKEAGTFVPARMKKKNIL